MTDTISRIPSVEALNRMIMEDAPQEVLINACQFIDLASCFDPIFEPPIDFLEECRKRQAAAQSPYRCTIQKKIGNTWYEVETECAGDELLADKVKRLIFSDREVA